jgi:filamin
VGKYKVAIKWNGREIEGSPFHPLISDPRKVRPTGGWDRILDANRCLVCRLNETKNIEFDARQAGPGRLTCKMRGPDGPINCNLNNQSDGIYLLSFTPTREGEYQADLFWNDVPIPNSPMTCIVKGMPSAPVNHDKVVLTGHGLREARIREEAEFVIDGTEAGPGGCCADGGVL